MMLTQRYYLHYHQLPIGFTLAPASSKLVPSNIREDLHTGDLLSYYSEMGIQFKPGLGSCTTMYTRESRICLVSEAKRGNCFVSSSSNKIWAKLQKELQISSKLLSGQKMWSVCVVCGKYFYWLSPAAHIFLFVRERPVIPVTLATVFLLNLL